MTHALSRIYQDGAYLRHNPTWHVEDSAAKAEWIARLLATHGVRPFTVCEVGCGAGEVLCQLAQRMGRGVTFSGYEPSPQAFALCREREAANLHYYCRDLPAEEAHFDLVLAIDVVEHVEDYLGFLKSLRSKGRQAVFRIPLNLSVQSILCRSAPLLEARAAFGHLHYFTRETAIATLEDAGYRIIDIVHTYGPFSRQHLGLSRYLSRLLKQGLFRLNRAWMARLLDGFSVLILAE